MFDQTKIFCLLFCVCEVTICYKHDFIVSLTTSPMLYSHPKVQIIENNTLFYNTPPTIRLYSECQIGNNNRISLYFYYKYKKKTNYYPPTIQFLQPRHSIMFQWLKYTDYTIANAILYVEHTLSFMVNMQVPTPKLYFSGTK